MTNRNAFLVAACLGLLAIVSCQKDVTSAQGDEVEVTVVVEAPGEMSTKGVGDGQAADNLVFAVFDEEGNECTMLRQGDWKNSIGVANELKFDDSAKPSVTVKTTLVKGKEYTFVCWAQKKDTDCYDFSNMKQIGVSYQNAEGKNYVAQDDSRDAFYAAVPSGVIKDGYTIGITLRRPFAQVNVGTADIQAAQDAGLDVTNLYSTMTLTNVADKLHTFVGAKAGDGDGDGKVEGSKTVSFALAPAIYDRQWLTIRKEGYENKKFGWLAMNYVLVDETNSTVSFSIYEGEDFKLSDYTNANVSLKRNYRTHIIGDLLTASGQVQVVLEPDFYLEDFVR